MYNVAFLRCKKQNNNHHHILSSYKHQNYIYFPQLQSSKVVFELLWLWICIDNNFVKPEGTLFLLYIRKLSHCVSCRISHNLENLVDFKRHDSCFEMSHPNDFCISIRNHANCTVMVKCANVYSIHLCLYWTVTFLVWLNYAAKKLDVLVQRMTAKTE